jgi:glycosyltransferase involved in cell wall biosynthesis
MKILMVSDAFYPKIDGVSTYLMNVISYLCNKGHKVVLIVPEYKAKYREFKVKNIKIYRVNSFSLPSYPEASVAIPDFIVMKKIIQDFNPDIVHIHTPATLGLSSMIISKSQKIPIVSTYHTSIPDFIFYLSPIKLLKLDRFLFEFSGRKKLSTKPKSKFVKLFDKNLKEFQQNFKKFNKKIDIKYLHKKDDRQEPISQKAIWALSNGFLNNSNLVIAPTKCIADELIKHNLKSNLKVISNGVELDIFQQKQDYIIRVPGFLHVGRLGHEKRVNVILDAMAIVIKHHKAATLSVVGDGPVFNVLKKKIIDLELEKNVFLLGYKERSALPKIYANHDVFVTASEIETQGLVLIEAMACGLPVIGVNVLGIPEVVHDGITGYLVKRRDYKTIAKRMIQLIENPSLIQELGENSRKESEKHELNKCLKQLEDTYLDLVNIDN